MHKIIDNENNSSLILEEAKRSIRHENIYKEKKPSSINTDALEITGEDINAILLPEDVNAPTSTLRMWILAFCLSALIAGVDSFFSMRFPLSQ